MCRRNGNSLPCRDAALEFTGSADIMPGLACSFMAIRLIGPGLGISVMLFSFALLRS
jgi:hypothetical protein